jgi:hypothetical protein
MKPNADCQWKVLSGVLGILLACLLLGTVSQARGDAVPVAYTTTTVDTSSGMLTTEATSTVPFSMTSSVGMSSSSGPNTGSDGVNSYTSSGSAVVNINGSLGASSTLSVSGPEDPNPGFTLVGSEALLTDELTVTAPGIPTGTLGTFDPTVTIMGSATSPASANFSYVIVNAGYGVAETSSVAQMSAANYAYNVIGPTSNCSPVSPDLGTLTCTLSFPESSWLPITWGVPFELATDLDAYVFATPGSGGIAEGGTANFYDTAQITSIALDANGNPVTDFSITSASGLDYTANGITPEPSSLSLFGLGILFLAFVAKRGLAAERS